MGWRGQHNRDLDDERRWRALPLRERYNWTGVVALALASIIIIGAFAWQSM